MTMTAANSCLNALNTHHLSSPHPNTPNCDASVSKHDGNCSGSISSPRYVVFFTFLLFTTIELSLFEIRMAMTTTNSHFNASNNFQNGYYLTSTSHHSKQ